MNTIINELIIGEMMDMGKIENPKVSVIVPVYNVKPYLERCIDSLISQSLKEIEIILVDDGSTDGSAAICDDYARRDERIVVIHKQNGGVSSARNVGIDFAKGDYIMFVDSDDWVEPEFCNLPYDVAKQNDADMVMFGLNMINGSRKYRNVEVPEGLFTSKETALYLLTGPVQNYSVNKIIRGSIAKKVHFIEGMIFEDIDANYRFVLGCDSFVCIEDRLYNYVIRDGSITTTRNRKHFNDLFISHYRKYLDLKNLGFDPYKTVDLYGLCRAALLYLIYIGSDDEYSKDASSVLKEHWAETGDKFSLKRRALMQLYSISPVMFDLFCKLGGKRL